MECGQGAETSEGAVNTPQPPFADMVWIPARTFRMGSDRHYPEERPAHLVSVDGFWIDRAPVTNARFARFVEATRHVTFAETVPDPAQYPDALPEMLYAGSLVFQRPPGPVDLNAFTNWFLVIPWLVLAIALSTILGASLWNVILVIAITSWASTARLVRAQALSVRERSYIERSRALGATHWHTVTRHVLPNVFPVLFANTILTVGLAILAETTLAILGLSAGISWGRIIENAFTGGAMTAGWWWWLIPPGICIVLVTLAFTMIGFALDEVLSPRLRER